MRNAPSVKVGIQTLHILQSHYPERLGLAVCYHPPRLFSMMWKASFLPALCADHNTSNSSAACASACLAADV